MKLIVLISVYLNVRAEYDGDITSFHLDGVEHVDVHGNYADKSKYFESDIDKTIPKIEKSDFLQSDYGDFETPADTEPFHTKHTTNQIKPDLENYGSYYYDGRPDFWTRQRNYSIFDDDMDVEDSRPYSYVQKVPFSRGSSSDFTTHPNRYHELTENKNTSKQINDMMRHFLAKFIVEKYGHKKKDRKNSSQESKLLYTNPLWDLKNKALNKIKQVFGLFTVINFNNTECNATNWAGTWQGVCLTSLQCTVQQGTQFGNCASGYGVCCVFKGSCGDSSSRNCSYFKSPNYPDYYPANGGVITPTTTVAPTVFPTPDPRLHWYYYKQLDELSRQSSTDTTSCTFSVYKTSTAINQLRIDFIDLDLAAPTNGVCTNERLIITGQNSNSPVPVICGYNTGQHVYVEVSQMTGPLQIMVLSATGARKRFKIRICQYATCTGAQSNCLQYYTGTTGIIQSFNYDQAAMFNRSVPGYFNNLNYAICIRREAGFCSVTFTNTKNGQTNPFQIVNLLPNGQTTVPRGQAGVDVINCPDDYIIIDGTRLCGDRLNDGSTGANFSVNAPIVDASNGPIVVHFRTNTNVTGLGFKLYYTQNTCAST